MDVVQLHYVIMSYISVLFRRQRCYILLFCLSDCNVTNFFCVLVLSFVLFIAVVVVSCSFVFIQGVECVCS
jgi:hypothetical protein